MIIGFILNAVVILINFLIDLLPSVSLNSAIAQQITAAAHYVAIWNNFFPLTTLFACVNIIIVIELAVAIYRIIDKVRKMIPTQS